MVTYRGMLKTKNDALLLIQATNMGVLQRLKSRLSEYEKSAISSGDVFVLSEQESNVKRWTDGFNWSASRMQGDFLIYKRITNGFVENMFKKVLSIQMDHHKFHVISYYNPESYLKSPSEDQELKRKMYLNESSASGSFESLDFQEKEPEEYSGSTYGKQYPNQPYERFAKPNAMPPFHEIQLKKHSMSSYETFSPQSSISSPTLTQENKSKSSFPSLNEVRTLPPLATVSDATDPHFVRYRLDQKQLNLLNNFFY